VTPARTYTARVLSLLAAVALIAASCGLTRDSDGVAATVTLPDGSQVEISRTELDDLYNPIVADTEFVDLAYQGQVPEGLRASILGDIIDDTVLGYLVADAGGVVDEAATAEGTNRITGAVAGLFQLDPDPTASAQAKFETIPYLPFLAGLQAKVFALGTSLRSGELGDETVEVPCASHILVETEEEALAIVAELSAGADFAQLAIERSTGPSGPSGGVLGCADPSSYVPEFAEAITNAPVGAVVGPVQTQFGFHVITVTATEEQTVGAPNEADLVEAAVRAGMSQVTVDVSPEIGEWNPAASGVVPAN